jgi:trans-aconitate methyltransferase
VLDLGCGTATLTILVKQAHPDADVIGLDGDPRVLEIAKSKITRAGLDVALDFMRRLEEASDTIDGMLPGMFVDAGFEHVEESARYRTVFGTLTLYQARKPG